MGQLLAEPVQLVLAQPALEERAGVDARGRVPLEEHLVAGLAVVLAAEEVVEADLVQAGRRGVGGDVPAHAEAGPVGPGHHDGRVPPDVGADPPFHVLVAREPRLALRRDRVDVVGAAQARHADLLLTRPLQQPEHHVPGPGPAAGAHHAVERVDPVPGFVRVDVRQLRGQPVADDGETLASGSHGVFLAFAGRAAVGRHVRSVRGGWSPPGLCRVGPDQFWCLRSGNAPAYLQVTGSRDLLRQRPGHLSLVPGSARCQAGYTVS